MNDRNEFESKDLDFLKSTKRPNLPPSDKMVKFGLEMLSHSSIGIELLDFIREKNIKIKVITGPEERAFAPDNENVVIMLKTVNPANPSRFVLLLVSGVRELMQQEDGIEKPGYVGQRDDILEKFRVSTGDKVGYMCAVAYEINEILTFSNYHITEELKKMGYKKDWDTFLQAI